MDIHLDTCQIEKYIHTRSVFILFYFGELLGGEKVSYLQEALINEVNMCCLWKKLVCCAIWQTFVLALFI